MWPWRRVSHPGIVVLRRRVLPRRPPYRAVVVITGGGSIRARQVGSQWTMVLLPTAVALVVCGVLAITVFGFGMDFASIFLLTVGLVSGIGCVVSATATNTIDADGLTGLAVVERRAMGISWRKRAGSFTLVHHELWLGGTRLLEPDWRGRALSVFVEGSPVVLAALRSPEEIEREIAALPASVQARLTDEPRTVLARVGS
jgi:hypothetical protein